MLTVASDSIYDENRPIRGRGPVPAHVSMEAGSDLSRPLGSRAASGPGNCVGPLRATGNPPWSSPDPIASQIIQVKLAKGTLRTDPCVGSVEAVRGVQDPCSGCDRPITPDHVEMRAAFADGGHLGFHPWCFVAWYRATHRLESTLDPRLLMAARLQRIQGRIREGGLPAQRVSAAAYRAGTGRECAGCDESIDRRQIEVDVDPGGSGQAASMHLECFAVLLVETGEQPSNGAAHASDDRCVLCCLPIDLPTPVAYLAGAMAHFGCAFR